MPSQPSRSLRTFEEVANRIRAMLASGQFKTGERLPAERDLSQQLGVSRAALREALRTLEMAGMLELKKGKSGGAFVTSGSPRAQAVSNSMRDLFYLGDISLEQLTEARVWIEEVVARVACERATKEEIDEMEDSLRRAEILYREGRFAEKSAVNVEFHNMLARATHNPVLVMNVQALTGMLMHFALRVGAEKMPLGLAERKRIIAALRERDADRAAKELVMMMKKWHRLYRRLARQMGGLEPAPD